MKFKFIFIVLVTLPFSILSQIKSGPMLGYSEMREVLIWVQTEKTAKVHIEFSEIGMPHEKYKTPVLETSSENNFIAKIIATDVLPGKKYAYEVYLNNIKQNFSYPLEFKTQTLWQYRTDPPEFSFVFGTCAYTNESRFDRPGTPYGKDSSAFKTIHEMKPDFMVWGGDNVYLREVDWNTKSGITKRYDDFKSQEILQPLWANIHHYATWDDHDFGPNDSNRSFWMKDASLETFKNYWGNPNYIFKDEAVTGTFFWEDCQFFLLDDRWFRAPNELRDPEKDYFGEKQLNWLIDALKSSSAPFKFIVSGGQIVNPVAVYETMATFPAERKKLLDKIEEQDIWGVFFLTGDRHHTNVQKLFRTNNYPLFELTSSALSAGGGSPTKQELEESPIVEGTQVNMENNFSMLTVSGPRKDRMLTIKNYSIFGKENFTLKVKASDLRKPKD